MAGFRIEGNTSANVAEVDANNNIQVVTPQVNAIAGFNLNAVSVDEGKNTGFRYARNLTASMYGRLWVGIDTPIFNDFFNYTAQNTAQWQSATTTFTFAYNVTSSLQFNSGAITTTGAAQILQSRRTFPIFGGSSLIVGFSIVTSTALPAVNQQFEIGIFSANVGATPYTPLDGMYMRWNSNGLYAVMNQNGVETVTQLVTPANMAAAAGISVDYHIMINHYVCEFYGQSGANPNVLLGVIQTPQSGGPGFASVSLPISMRLYNFGTAASGTNFKITDTWVIQQDVQKTQPYGHIQCGQGLSIYQGQNGGTMGSLASYANSLAAGAGAALTNTTTLVTGLGGQCAILPTLTVGTDGIVCSYQNPAGSVTQTPRTLFITGIKVQGAVTTVLAGGPVLYAYSIAYGHTAVSMATAEAASTKAPRRIPLGFETFAVTAAVGVLGSVGGATEDFDQAPIVVNPGEFVSLVAKNLGVVTTTGVITLLVTFIGYFD